MDEPKEPKFPWKSLMRGAEVAISPVACAFVGGFLGQWLGDKLNGLAPLPLLAGVVFGFIIGLRRVFHWLNQNK
ncbi:MAG: AtpZ/AtpI family protein [Candidatus Caenarcaniphilales bacterium]|nr:AtpZ/AtpI family protein [Candidatus Caenarcaniphilales bacterium]